MKRHRGDRPSAFFLLLLFALLLIGAWLLWNWRTGPPPVPTPTASETVPLTLMPTRTTRVPDTLIPTKTPYAVPTANFPPTRTVRPTLEPTQDQPTPTVVITVPIITLIETITPQTLGTPKTCWNPYWKMWLSGCLNWVNPSVVVKEPRR